MNDIAAALANADSEVFGARRLLFSRREASSLLNFSLRQIDRLIANRKLSVVRSGSRVLIHRQELHRFVNNGLPYSHPNS